MDKKTLLPNQKIQLKENLVTTKIGDETVLMTIESGKYYSITSEGSQIWEMIKQPTTAEEICKKLIAKYNVSLEQCLKDTIPFFNKLYDDGFLLLVD